MFNNVNKLRRKVIKEMCYQGQHYTQQELFFKEFWKNMNYEFSEANNTCTATFILERFLSVLPLEHISEESLINTIKDVYTAKNEESVTFCTGCFATSKEGLGSNRCGVDDVAKGINYCDKCSSKGKLIVIPNNSAEYIRKNIYQVGKR